LADVIVSIFHGGPAEEGVAGGLEQALAVDDALALVFVGLW
jgi:hypothetical protein